MILGVVGSRSFKNYTLLKESLEPLSITKIVSGGARGADSLAIEYAKEFNIPYYEYLPNFGRYGYPAALFKRNVEIVEASDVLVAFWDGTSKGTQHAINFTKARNKEIIVITYDSI